MENKETVKSIKEYAKELDALLWEIQKAGYAVRHLSHAGEVDALYDCNTANVENEKIITLFAF